MRRAPHDGQKPLSLQENATKCSNRHPLHFTRRKPCLSIPHRRYLRNSRAPVTLELNIDTPDIHQYRTQHQVYPVFNHSLPVRLCPVRNRQFCHCASLILRISTSIASPISTPPDCGIRTTHWIEGRHPSKCSVLEKCVLLAKFVLKIRCISHRNILTNDSIRSTLRACSLI